MNTSVSLKYFVNGCSSTASSSYQILLNMIFLRIIKTWTLHHTLFSCQHLQNFIPLPMMEYRSSKKELNGVMISTLHQNLNVQNVPWAVTTIPNSVMDNAKLVLQLLTLISKPNKFQKDDVDVQSAFLKKYGEDVPEVITATVQSLVLYGTLVEVDFDTKKLILHICQLSGHLCTWTKATSETFQIQW